PHPSHPGAPAALPPGSVVTTASGTSDFVVDHVAAAGSTTTLSEVLQAGYSAGPGAGSAPGPPDQTGVAGAVDVTVLPGQTWTCTFNNSVNTATIQVLKQVDGVQV